jgi:hypothetical protein
VSGIWCTESADSAEGGIRDALSIHRQIQQDAKSIQYLRRQRLAIDADCSRNRHKKIGFQRENDSIRIGAWEANGSRSGLDR